MYHPTPDSHSEKANSLVATDSIFLNNIYQSFAPEIKNMILQTKDTGSEGNCSVQNFLCAIYYKADTNNLELSIGFDGLFSRLCKNNWLEKPAIEEPINNSDKDFDS